MAKSENHFPTEICLNNEPLVGNYLANDNSLATLYTTFRHMITCVLFVLLGVTIQAICNDFGYTISFAGGAVLFGGAVFLLRKYNNAGIRFNTVNRLGQCLSPTTYCLGYHLEKLL